MWKQIDLYNKPEEPNGALLALIGRHKARPSVAPRCRLIFSLLPRSAALPYHPQRQQSHSSRVVGSGSRMESLVAALPLGGAAAAAAAVGGLLAAAALAGRAGLVGPKNNGSNAPPGQSADGDPPLPSLINAGPPIIASCLPDPPGRCRLLLFIAPWGDGGLGKKFLQHNHVHFLCAYE